MVRIIKALLYGYLGAVLAGLLVALAGTSLDFSYGAIVSSASLSGAALGVIGFTLPWWQPMIAARSHSRRD